MYVSTLSLFSVTSDPITGGCELSCGCWELNSTPLEEQLVLLTAEPLTLFQRLKQQPFTLAVFQLQLRWEMHG